MTAAPYRPGAPAEDVVADLSDLDEEFGKPAPVLPRDGRDRPLIVPPHGGRPVAYQRASTFANVLTDQSGLTTWKVRHAVHGVARSAALTARAAAAQYGEKDLDAVIEDGLLLDGASDAAGFGTAFHRFTEPDARGRSADVPDAILADVASFWHAMDSTGLKIVATEQFVVNDEYEVAGTFDHIVELPDGLGCVVADKKTGKYKPKEHAVQLAVYAGGALYDAHPDLGDVPPTGADLGEAHRTRLDVRQDLALLIHTPHGGGRTELFWIRLDRGREAIERALWLRAWRSADDVGMPYAAGLAVLDHARTQDVEPDGVTWTDAAQRAARDGVQALAADGESLVTIDRTSLGRGGPGGALPTNAPSPSTPAPDAPTVPPVGEGAPHLYDYIAQPSADVREQVAATTAADRRARLLERLVATTSTDEIDALFAKNRDLWDEGIRSAARAHVEYLRSPDRAQAKDRQEGTRTGPDPDRERARQISRDGLENLLANAPTVERIGELFEANRDLWDEGIRELARARKSLIEGGLV